jgi:hypothetical protein
MMMESFPSVGDMAAFDGGECEVACIRAGHPLSRSSVR